MKATTTRPNRQRRRALDRQRRDADRRARILIRRSLHGLPVAIRGPRDLVVVVDGQPAPWAIPAKRVDWSVRLLCGDEVAGDVANLECEPGHVRVLVIMPSRGCVHMNTVGLRLMQKGGAA